MSETTAQITLDGYTDPALNQLASQAYVNEQIAAAITAAGADAGLQGQLPAGAYGMIIGTSGTPGVVVVTSLSALGAYLPTSLPAQTGQLWNNNGVVCVS